MCWGVGKVRGDVGKGEMRKEMWGSVLGPHTLTHFPTPPHILSHTPTHFLSPYTLLPPFPLTPYTLPHFSTPHTSFLISPTVPHPKTFPYTSPHTSSHSSPDLPLHPNTLPHSYHALSPHSVARLGYFSPIGLLSYRLGSKKCGLATCDFLGYF